MVMVPVVMPVAVDVFQRLMGMLVRVLAPEDCQHRHGQQRCRKQLYRGDRFTQHRHRERGADEGRGSEDPLRARRA